MSVFSNSELAYLREVRQLGRLATVGADGFPQVVPVGWRYNPERDTIDIGGRDPDEFVATRKYRNVRENRHVGFVVDDVLPPWRPRAVSIRGDAEAIDERNADGTRTALIRITPRKVVSWGLEPAREREASGAAGDGAARAA